VLVGQPLVARHLPIEQHRKNFAIAAPIELGAIVRGQRRQAMTLGKNREGFRVQVHVVDEGAVDVEDDGARRITKGHI